MVQHVKESLEPPHNRIIAIIGHSKGAVVALTHAAQYKTLAYQEKGSSSSILGNTCSSTRIEPDRLLISLSGRYDGNHSTLLSRFTSEQKDQLNTHGQFLWLKYRAGSSLNPVKRDYIVTQEAIDTARSLSLNYLKDLPEQTRVLCLHGRADGTVLSEESIKIDRQIRLNQRNSSDLVLIEGAQHNWDGEGEAEMLTHLISAWIKQRSTTQLKRLPDHKLADHLAQN